MTNFIKNISAFATGVLMLGSTFGQANADCNTLDPICSDAGVQFTASSGVTAASVTNPGNTYNCLGSSPNPTWYYMQVSVSGPLVFSLSAPQDIDFIIYGPFANLPDAQAGCESYGLGGAGGNVIDCSYSGTNMETPAIPNAQVGEVYVLLITNYANSVQNVDFTQTNSGAAGAGDLDCNIIVVPPCVSDPGTFVLHKNGTLTTSPIYLCQTDTYDIISNGDYILPNDTIAQPVGDGGYTAQLMWLVYSAAPTSGDPSTDPAFLNFAIPSDDIVDANNAGSPIVTNFGCGTYWLVPVAGDDGVGGNGGVANGSNDNGQLHWDKNGNGCYNLGTPIQVTYACPITGTPTVNCNPPPGVVNGVNVALSGGSGAYTVVNLGAGNLASTNVANGGTATIANLNNNNAWNISVTDAQGCSASFNGVFSAPVITNVTITPAPDCPLGGNGSVNVTVNPSSGNGAPYGIVMANDPVTVGTSDSYSNIAGTIVPIVVTDAQGCIADSTVTITSAGHYIDVQITNLQGEDCYGDGNGTATISATPTPSGTVTGVVWTSPTGGIVNGGNNAPLAPMEPGIWTVCVTDDIGCSVCIPVEITAPQELDVYVDNSNEPVCFGYADGSIDVGVSGGTSPITYSWSHNTGLTGDVANTIGAGTYTAYVTDGNGCQDSVQVLLGEPDELTATFTVKDIDCFGASTGAIITNVVNGAQGNVSYNWNMGGVVPNPADTMSTASNLPVGTYVLTILDQNGCSNEYQWTLTQNPQLVLAITTDPAQCRSQSFQTTDGVVAVSASGGVSDYDYLWTQVATGATSVNTTWGGRPPGLYSVTATDSKGCTITQTITLDSISPISSFVITSAQLDGNLEGTAPVTVNFTNTSTNFTKPTSGDDTTFFWHLNWEDEFPNGGAPGVFTDSWYTQFDTTYTGEEVYKICLVVINDNNCKDTSCQEIIVHEQPIFKPVNVFTPGGGGINDSFQFLELSQAVETFHAVVVDRWGKTVFEFNSINDSWNGDNKNGKPCSDGVYFYNYEAEFTNSTSTTGQGTVTLVRDK